MLMKHVYKITIFYSLIFLKLLPMDNAKISMDDSLLSVHTNKSLKKKILDLSPYQKNQF